MATDFRRITFNQNELRTAIDSHPGIGKAPEGEISIIRSKRVDGQNGYEIEAFDLESQQAQQYFIDEDDALEMLIQSCLLSPVLFAKQCRPAQDRPQAGSGS
ncbi:MAG TPA: hypothetical protein ENI69_01235 [Rhodospirillales bacterium]|nr:hypothetical protein [Rhodospirillales bacterium]